MPRYALTPEEFAHIEVLRRKNQNTLGYNEALEVAAVAADTFAVPDTFSSSAAQLGDVDHRWRAAFIQHLRSLKRELKS